MGIGLTKREPKPTGLALPLVAAAAAAACAALQVLHIAADGASLDEVRALRLVVTRVSTQSTPCEYSQYGVRSLRAPRARSAPRVHTLRVPTCGRQLVSSQGTP